MDRRWKMEDIAKDENKRAVQSVRKAKTGPSEGC